LVRRLALSLPKTRKATNELFSPVEADLTSASTIARRLCHGPEKPAIPGAASRSHSLCAPDRSDRTRFFDGHGGRPSDAPVSAAALVAKARGPRSGQSHRTAAPLRRRRPRDRSVPPLGQCSRQFPPHLQGERATASTNGAEPTDNVWFDLTFNARSPSARLIHAGIVCKELTRLRPVTTQRHVGCRNIHRHRIGQSARIERPRSWHLVPRQAGRRIVEPSAPLARRSAGIRRKTP
jgi:hypothetical protein